MRKRGFLLFFLPLLLAVPAWPGYEDLKKDWERHKATPFFRDYIEIRSREEVPPPLRDETLEKEVAKIKEIKEKWAKVFEEFEDKEVFYRPNPHLIKQLIPAKESVAVAMATLAGHFSLEELEIIALLRNPGVRSAESSLRASIEAYGQVSNLDEILRQYSAFTRDLMTGVGPMMRGEGIEIYFPFPGVLALKGEVVTAEVKASREALEIARRTAITKIRQTYWNLLYVRGAQQIYREMLGLLEQLEKVAASLYETGKVSFQDLIKVRIEREKMEEELRTLTEEQRNLEAKIIEILDLPAGIPLGRPKIPEILVKIPQIDHLYSQALAKKQELRQMRAMIDKMERMIEMSETMIYPPYTLGFTFFQKELISQTGSMRMKDSFPTKSTASLGEGLPKMPFYGTNEAYLRETRQKLAAAKADLKKMEDETIFMVREAWFRLDLAKREEALYAQRVIELSRAALEVSKRGYESGLLGFAEVIMTYKDWLNDRLAVERRRSDLGIAYAQLEEALGGTWKE